MKTVSYTHLPPIIAGTKNTDFVNVLNLFSEFSDRDSARAVSYTHLDVYKRQIVYIHIDPGIDDIAVGNAELKLVYQYLSAAVLVQKFHLHGILVADAKTAHLS